MKITQIIINNYRAFYNEKGQETSKHVLSLGDGKNLLIYGENGSGKSSFYKALHDLFIASDAPDHHLIQNVFAKNHEPDVQPFVEITVSENGQADRVFRFSSDRVASTVSDELLRSVIRNRSFMTYRDLLRVHFVKDAEVNMFDFLFGKEGLLANVSNPASTAPETNLKMYDLFQAVTNSPDERNIGDFVAGVNQILLDLKDTLNHLLLYFHKSITVSFSPLTGQSVRDGAALVKINVSYFGIDLNNEREQYHHFLNEARLSALAICIFLAANLSVPQPDLRILFLDDIFTGLDMSNRMPLLDILTAPVIKGTTSKTFTGHQIFLTTYDRQWFELAKTQLPAGKWQFQEMFIDHGTDEAAKFDQPVWRPSMDDMKKAQHYFQNKDYPACANYQRKICESLIKKFLPDHLKYESSAGGDIVPIKKLNTFITNLRLYLKQCGLDFTPFEKLLDCTRVVMNPLSHDDLESQVYKRELELVFEIISELKKLKNTVLVDAGQKIVMKKINPVTGYERTYVSELTTPIRKIEYGPVVKIAKIMILPLTEDENGTEKSISFEGEFGIVYGKFCLWLNVEKAENPYSEFTREDGTPLTDIIPSP